MFFSSSHTIAIYNSSPAPDTNIPCHQELSEAASIPYDHVAYVAHLQTKGSFMREYEGGPKKDSKDLGQKLLRADQNVPENSRFSDGVFKATCERLRSRNAPKIIQDIGRLIVPSAEELADFGAEHLKRLVESVDEEWENSIPVTHPRP